MRRDGRVQTGTRVEGFRDTGCAGVQGNRKGEIREHRRVRKLREMVVDKG